MGQLAAVQSGPARHDATRDHGSRVPRLRFINSIAWLAAHPDDVKHVLVDNHRAYHKGFGLQALKPIVGEGLLTSEDEFHKRQRRLIQPAFHRQRIEAYAGVMTGYTDRTLATWADGQAFDLHDQMMHLTMLIVARCLFDADLAVDAAHDADSLGHSITALIEQFNPTRIGPIGQFIDRFDLKKQRARRRNLAVIDGLILDLIRDRRVEERDRGDLLSMILASQDGDMGSEGSGRGMTDAQARDEMITLFLAGHETTAIALTWTFYLLAKHPAVEAKLLAELNSVLGAPGARLPELGDLDRLPYTRQVFAESMRLYPPAYATARIAQQDDEFGGVHVKKGESVIVSQWVTHRDPRWWDDPERFDPERFSAAAEAARPSSPTSPLAAARAAASASNSPGWRERCCWRPLHTATVWKSIPAMCL